ncbi:hypothetical protein BKA70DRAFT_1310445 [Coprinopsis sp. MPI-PUGE-AT-0042]|nr:hypothetical protein BKA70DRAFT_1310445 [Coprinopsis sp. MPI-PUGE-AT-0042]
MSDNTLIGQIPSEIWAIVFAFVLGFDPFGPDERQAYNRLRSVCTTWRMIVATTPGLCPGLSIEWNQFALPWSMETFKTRYASWLSVISNNYPYYLVLGDTWDDFHGEEPTSVIHYLLCEATPTPTTLELHSSKILGRMLCMTDSCDTVIRLNVAPNYQDLEGNPLSRLPLIFPQLESFSTNTHTTLTNLFTSPHLRSLTLLGVLGLSGDLARVCEGLPSLRELMVSSEVYLDDLRSPPRVTLDTPLNHSGLETLIVIGQDFIPVMNHFTLPSLKFFGLRLWEIDEDIPIIGNTLPAFFQRSCLFNLPVSLQGDCDEHSFAAVTRSLPPMTTLLLQLCVTPDGNNVDEGKPAPSPPELDFSGIKDIVCFDGLPVHKWRDQSSCDRAIKVYMPADGMGEDETEALRKEMWEKSCIMELCSSRVAEDIPGLSLSPMALEWISDYVA